MSRPEQFREDPESPKKNVDESLTDLAARIEGKKQEEPVAILAQADPPSWEHDPNDATPTVSTLPSLPTTHPAAITEWNLEKAIPVSEARALISHFQARTRNNLRELNRQATGTEPEALAKKRIAETAIKQLPQRIVHVAIARNWRKDITLETFDKMAAHYVESGRGDTFYNEWNDIMPQANDSHFYDKFTGKKKLRGDNAELINNPDHPISPLDMDTILSKLKIMKHWILEDAFQTKRGWFKQNILRMDEWRDLDDDEKNEAQEALMTEFNLQGIDESMTAKYIVDPPGLSSMSGLSTAQKHDRLTGKLFQEYALHVSQAAETCIVDPELKKRILVDRANAGSRYSHAIGKAHSQYLANR